MPEAYDPFDPEYIGGPSTITDWLRVAGGMTAVVAASVPTTTVPPLLLSALTYRRFRDEEKMLARHRMCDWAAFCTRRILGCDLRILDRERLSSDRPGLMLVSNHQSYVDIPIIMGGLRVGAFLSKDLVSYLPNIGLCAYLGGTIYLKRGSSESRRQALEDTIRMCAESTPVVVFPEGTRSRSGALREFIQPGSIRAAYAHGLRVGTFALDGTGRILPPTNDRFRRHERVVIAVGETFSPRDHASPEAFVDAVWGGVKVSFARARAARLGPVWPPPGSTTL